MQITFTKDITTDDEPPIVIKAGAIGYLIGRRLVIPVTDKIKISSVQQMDLPKGNLVYDFNEDDMPWHDSFEGPIVVRLEYGNKKQSR